MPRDGGRTSGNRTDAEDSLRGIFERYYVFGCFEAGKEKGGV